ncbi:MAG: hypothetical protein K8L91_14165 [Anaerolineae bacterium]|nr:hypothetical protein [Anaerolineae bacterium]
MDPIGTILLALWGGLSALGGWTIMSHKAMPLKTRRIMSEEEIFIYGKWCFIGSQFVLVGTMLAVIIADFFMVFPIIGIAIQAFALHKLVNG